MYGHAARIKVALISLQSNLYRFPLVSPATLLDPRNSSIVIDPESLLEQIHTDSEVGDRVRIVDVVQIPNADPAVATSRSVIVHGLTPEVGVGQLGHVSQYLCLIKGSVSYSLLHAKTSLPGM